MAKKGIKELIPTRRNGRLSRGLEARNKTLAEIKGLGGKLTGYSKRALVEISFSRLKRLYGGHFYSEKPENQRIEGHLKCMMMNKMMRELV